MSGAKKSMGTCARCAKKIIGYPYVIAVTNRPYHTGCWDTTLQEIAAWCINDKLSYGPYKRKTR